MKPSRATILIAALSLAVVLPGIAPAQTPAPRIDPAKLPTQTGQGSASAEMQTSDPANATPAELRIAAAKRQLQANPGKTQAYNDLALAFARRARETADPAYFRDAGEALAAGMKLSPNDFQLKKTQVVLLLGRQQFAQAKTEAIALNRHTPDDVTTYGYIAEADIALGDYQDAEPAAQWMLNLLPYNVPGLLIAAQLRELYGDAEGALECLDRAATETSPNETEELAWILNQEASVEIHAGKLDAAGRTLDQAARIFPRYPYTLENRARLEMEQGNAVEAIALLRQLRQTPQVLYRLAKAEAAAGHAREAEVAYASFEEAAKPLIDEPANANRELVLYYADRAYAGRTGKSNPANGGVGRQALDLAQREVRLRQDVWTLDAYAWALYVNGKYSEAELPMQKALAVGIRSGQIFDHAGRIAANLNKQADAARYFEAALQLNSSPEYAQDARAELAAIPAVPASQPKVEVLPLSSSVVVPAKAAAADSPSAATPFPVDSAVTEADSSRYRPAS